MRIVGVEKIDRLAVFVYVTRCADAPVTSIAINQVDRRVHRVDCADDFQVQRRLAVAVTHVHAAGNNTAEVVYFADVFFQLFAVAEKLFGRDCRFTVPNLVQRKTDDSANEQNDDESQHYDHAGNYQKDLFRGHRLFQSAE